MPSTIDSLQIEINAQAVKANTAIDKLVGKLNTLSSSLGKINGSNLVGLANGVQRLGTAMHTMSSVRTSDFTRLANNITKLGSINTVALNSAASSMSHLTRSFNNLGTVSANAIAVGDLAKNIARLGNKSVQNATTNIPQLATALKSLMQTLSTAPRVNSSIIQMTNALANLSNQGNRIRTAAHGVCSGLNNTNTVMKLSKKHTLSLSYAFGKFYANLFWVIRGVRALWKSISGTSDYIEAYNYYNVSFSKIASEWSKDYEKYGYDNAESYAESFTDRMNESFEKMSGIKIEVSEDGTGLLTETGLKNLGLNIQEITQYASQLASVTNSVGQTGEVSLAAASSFTKLGADISSLYNVDYSSVMSNLQSGLIGQSRALYKYGIDITNASLQTYAYNLGLSKSVSEMTQNEKMQLRMIAILDQSKISWGDLANTINTPSNMIRQLKNNLKEVGTALGQLFIPMLQKVLPIINGITIALKRLLVNIAGFFGVKLELDKFSQGYTDLEESVDDTADSYDNATESIKKFKGQLAGFDKLNTISTQSNSTDTDTSSGNTIDLTDEILKATSEYEKVWNEAYENMENEAQKYADRIVEIFKEGDFESVGSYISEGIQSALESINWNSVYSGASNFGSGVASFLNGLITPETFSSIGTTISNALNTVFISSISFSEEFDFTNLGTSLASAVNGFDFYSVLKNGITATGNFATGLLKALTGAVKGLDFGEIIDEVVSGVVDGLKNFDYKDLATSWGELLGAAITQLMNIDAKIDEMVTSLIDSIGEYFDEKIDECGGNVALGILKGIADGFVGIGTWIYDNLAKPFLDGFSSEFSQSKFTGKIGSIKDSFTEKWEEVTEWFTTAKDNFFKEFKDNFSKEKFKERIGSIKNAIKEKWEEVTEWWGARTLSIAATFLTAKATVDGWWSNVKSWWGEKKVSVISVLAIVKSTVDGWWDNVKNWWGEKKLKIGSSNTTAPDQVKKWFGYISDWWGEKKLKIGSSNTTAPDQVKKWFGYISDWWGEKKLKIGSSNTTTKEQVQNWLSCITSWWGEKKLAIANEISTKQKDVTDWWNSVKGWWGEKTLSISAKFDDIKKAWNELANTINSKLTIEIDTSTTIGKSLKILFGTNKIKLGNLPVFETGGFPEDGWFRANHGEIMGKFDNGQSVVANNMQITEGISDAVYRGNQALLTVMQQELIETRKQNETLKQLLAKETGISKDDLFKSVQGSAKEYTNRTGNPAFSY